MRSKNLLLSLLVTFLAFTFSVEAGTDGRALNLDWIEVGPDNIGGRIQAIQFDNQDATGKTFFIGAITGGIWKTTTGGLTWDKINTENQNVFATSFVQNAAGTVFVGTGLKGKYVGQGLLKSTDGNNFSLIASTDPQLDDNSDWAFINDVKLSSDGNIYVATNTGLMFSDNEGESWTKASLGIENLIGVCDNVEISSNGTVYTSFDGKAYVSAGGIDAFVLVSDDANELLLPDYDCEMFKFSASTVEADVAYALVINDDGELKGAYKTVDNGASWTIIVPGGGTQFAPFAGGTGFDASYILADPFDSDKVYLCGNKVYVGTKPFDDGYYGWDLAFFSGMMTMGVHQAVLDPNSQYRTYYATDFGVVSHNRIGGLVTTYNSHLNISSFNSVAEGINDKVLGGENTYGTLSFDVSGNTELNAGLIRGGKAGYTEMSVINPEIMILSGIEIDIQRTNDMGLSYSNEFIGEELGTNNNAEFTPFALWESFNDVNTKDSLYYHATEDMAANTVVIMRSNNNGYPFEYTLTEDLNNGDSVLVMDKIGAKFFVAIKDAVWMTEDVINLSKSPEWWEISDIDGIPSSIAYSTDGNYVFVGTEEGGVYRISNIVEAYDFLTADIENETSVIATDLVYQIEDRVITSIAIDPNDAEHVVFTCGDYGNDNYVFESNNAIGD
ncbi:MAG: hypothetical protein U9R32_07050, partial [Bacteroidota bacterium]|nr:hypothetical protein [Bacteroidota bacterium]